MHAGPARIRPVTCAGLDVIAQIFAHYVAASVVTFEETPPTATDWRRRLYDLAARHLPFLVATMGGKVARSAYAIVWRLEPAYRHSAEDTVYLARQHIGQGLGRLLPGRLLAASACAGVRTVIAVIADTGDPRSVALHRACGFTAAGRLTRVGQARPSHRHAPAPARP